jgi:hypothetical protein
MNNIKRTFSEDLSKKICPKCNEEKRLSEFHVSKSKTCKVQLYCKLCHKGMRDVTILKSKENGTHYSEMRLAKFKHKAKKNNIPFNLDIEDMIIPEKCPILGTKLTKGIINSKDLYAPSLDRIIPELGYVKGNVMWMSRKANTMKCNATKDELLNFANYIIENASIFGKKE